MVDSVNTALTNVDALEAGRKIEEKIHIIQGGNPEKVDVKGPSGNLVRYFQACGRH